MAKDKHNQRSSSLKPKKRRHFGWVFLASLGIGLLGLLLVGLSDKRTVHASPQDPAKLDTADLGNAVAAIQKANPGVQISVSLINLSTGAKDTFGSQGTFEGASTVKVLTAVDYLHEVEEGKASLSTMMGDYPASYQLQEMVNDSDNDAWDLLTNALGTSSFQDYAHSIGMSSYDVSENTLTSADEALLLRKLYKGELLNPADTKLLLSYMQHTNDEDLIPAALPSTVTVYHKYGLLDGDVHDASILVYDNRPIVLVIYTNGSDSDANFYNQRIPIFHQLTEAVLKYEYGL